MALVRVRHVVVKDEKSIAMVLCIVPLGLRATEVMQVIPVIMFTM